jgi:hypothetical protein
LRSWVIVKVKLKSTQVLLNCHVSRVWHVQRRRFCNTVNITFCMTYFACQYVQFVLIKCSSKLFLGWNAYWLVSQESFLVHNVEFVLTLRHESTIDPFNFILRRFWSIPLQLEYLITRKYMHAETLALLTKSLYFPNMKYLK